VFDHHDLSPELFERKFGRRGLIHRLLLAVEQRAFRGADVVIAPNESYAEVARSRGRVAPERLFVVRTAPHPDRIFPVEPRPELKAGRPHLVLWTGSMTQPQRTAALVGAADVLVNELGRQDITFGFVGPGDARPALEADLKSRGLGDYVVLPGSVGDELLRAWLATADVCVSADVSNQMNDVSTVTKVLDYMAMGRPIVQFPLREMSRVSGDATAYARENDSNDLAAKIAELLDDPGERERLGKAARARMLDGGMWPDQVPLFLDAIGAALSRRGPR
jgi:glycosyltransferase involved in cell wall biosynthesis